MGFSRLIGKQFAEPEGRGGAVAAFAMNRMNRAQYRAVEAALGKLRPGKVLDLGFGNGWLVNHLAGELAEHRFYGVETSEDMIRAATKRAGAHIRDQRMELVEGSAGRIPYDDGFFDVVYTVNTVYFWEDLLVDLAEIARVLRPGGLHLNAFYGRDWLDGLSMTREGFVKYSPEELELAAQKAGFATGLGEIQRDKSWLLVAKKES